MYILIRKTTRKFVTGFTLIELLIVIGMIAILSTVVLVAINPPRQFAQARNSQRISNVNTLLNAIGNRSAEHRGMFTDDICITPLPNTSTVIANSVGAYDLRLCVIPDYISELPFDPLEGHNSCVTNTCNGAGESYDTKYTVAQDGTTGRITVCAPLAKEPAIKDSTSYCLTR